MKPLVSILIPCHNAAPYVREAVESALMQEWPIEVIVVDDGSTDGSGQILMRYSGDRVKVVAPENPPGSASKARNLAYQNSRGEFIKFFDADDVMHPKMIESQMKVLGDCSCDIASAGWGRFYQDDLQSFELRPQSVWRSMDSRDWLVEAWMDARPMMQAGMFLIPRALLTKSGGWDENLTLIDDFEFFARLFSIGGTVRYTPEVPLMYRSGLSASLSGRKTDAAIESAYHSLTKGTGHLLSVRNDAKARRACANVLQDFVYSFYPRRKDLRDLVIASVRELGGSDLMPDGPPKFHRLRKVIGWKLARWIQCALGR